MNQIAKNHLFQLIDFGLAQHERPEGGFPPDCTTGDSGYVCHQFMSTAQPDYSADLCSFGLTLFECMSGIRMPLQGELFQQLRGGREQVLAGLDPERFQIGESVETPLISELAESEPKRVQNSRKTVLDPELFDAVLELIDPEPPRRPSISEWRKKH